jgi:hypothetical protein
MWLQTWRSQGVTIPFFMRDRHVCVHEHFKTKYYSQAPRMPIYASSAKSAKADAVILGSVAGRCDPNSVGVPTRYLIDA